MKQRPSDEKLVAYLDAELDDVEFAAVESWLERDSALRARVQVLSESTALLRESFEEVLREPVPERLLLAAAAQPKPRVFSFRPNLPFLGRRTLNVPRRWVAFAAAASVCGIVFGGSLGYLAGTPESQPQTQASWLDNIAGYHNLLIANANAGEVFDVPAGAEKKLPVDIRIPDLKPWRLAFQGARMMVVEGKPAYQFFYTTENKELGPITLTLWPSTKPDMAPSFDHRDHVNLMYWREAGHGYAIVGKANKGYMWGLFQDVSYQLRAH